MRIVFRGKKQRDQHLISHRQWGIGVCRVGEDRRLGCRVRSVYQIWKGGYSENKHENRKWYLKSIFYILYFQSPISRWFKILHACRQHFCQENVPQILIVDLSFYLMTNNRVTFYVYFFEYLFLDLIENEQRHIGQSETQFPQQQPFQYIYFKFQVLVVHDGRNIRFLKIKVPQMFFGYISHSLPPVIVSLCP